ncbi:MAG TPA: carboxypeptidase-like regulatory domain-containing protein, partial [Thermoanaerobaculia bacterium]
MTLFLGLSLYGAEQPVTIRLAWIEAPAANVAVTLRARNATGSSKPVEVVIGGQGASVPLPAGQWFVEAASPGYWSEPELVSVAGAPTETTLTLYRATRLRAQVAIPSKGTARTVDVYFNPTDTTSGQPTGSVSCPISDGALDCELPSGLYDLAFRIPGHASTYKWDVDLKTKPFADLGTLQFRAGATLSGQVVINGIGELDSLDKVKVTLRNESGVARNDALLNRQSVTAMTTRPNEKGFFSFDVLPGNYVLSAASPGLVSEERQITVIEGHEAILKEPLALERLWTLTVNTRLPAEGSNQPWRLAVTRYDSENHPTERIVSIPADGMVKLEKQLPGSYTVELRLHDSVWAAQSTFVDRDTTIDLTVSVVTVRGSVLLGDEPLAASLVFLSKDKGFRIPARTKPNGKFLVFLPAVPGDRWEEVEVQSSDPWIKRALKDVPLESDGEGVATMKLRLASNRIAGIVLDENERPVTQGLINISAADGSSQLEMSDGTFTIHGLDAGRYSLTASSRERETEGPVVVDIQDESENRYDVVLKIAPASQFQGSVVSANGPAIGASVFIGPTNNAPSIVATIPVDTTGAFAFRVPPQTRDMLVAVAAPGFSFRMMRLPIPATKLDLVVDQRGGMLSLEAPTAPLRPYVIHNGAILSAFTVAYLARGRFLT